MHGKGGGGGGRSKLQLPSPPCHMMTMHTLDARECVCSSCVQTHTLGIHSRTVLSRDAEATRCPDGEKATDNMASYREAKAVKILRKEINCNGKQRWRNQMRNGRKRWEDRKLRISCLVSDKSIRSGLWFKMPYHQARIHGSSGCTCCMWVGYI